MYKIVLTKQAAKDAGKLERHNLKSKAMNLIRMIQTDPFVYPPPFIFGFRLFSEVRP